MPSKRNGFFPGRTTSSEPADGSPSNVAQTYTAAPYGEEQTAAYDASVTVKPKSNVSLTTGAAAPAEAATTAAPHIATPK
jgi:hypothetical protein